MFLGSSAPTQASDLKVIVDLGSGILVEVLSLAESSSGKDVNYQHHVYETAYQEVGTVSCSTYITNLHVYSCMILYSLLLLVKYRMRNPCKYVQSYLHL